MKKFLSLTLAAVTSLSLLAACAPAAEQLDPAITIASSDAATYADWLDNRLDVIPDDVVLGIGTNEAYGVDMANFDSDGYIARAIGDEVLLFGKTADGLDRAVREYAKAADKGATANLDTVYHEGARIKKMTIAGNDISQYKIVYSADPEGREMKAPNGTGKTYGNAEYAAGELARLIKNATGIMLQTVTEEGDFPMIRIGYITDGSCGENGFSYKVENGNLYINGAPYGNGCANGVHYFLQQECGWQGLLSWGDSYLHSSDLVAVPDGASATVDPIFDYSAFKAPYVFSYENERDRGWYRGIVTHACHGLASFDMPVREGDQLCYTNEDTYLTLFDKVYARVTAAETAGQVIGEDLLWIDLSQYDYPNYCMCGDCFTVYHKEEGKAHSGAIIRFLNRLADDMEAEGKGGIKYLFFAYYATNIPPKTEAHPDVWVTFCTDGNCSAHPMDGSECGYLTPDSHPLMMEPELSNRDFDQWLRGWTEKCENVYLWHYALPNNFGNYTYFENIYADMMYLKELGLKGMYLESEYNGYGFSHLRTQLMSALVWYPEITEEEYSILCDNTMRFEYGDGYEYVKAYIDILEECERPIGCFNCWGYGADEIFNTKNWDTEIFYSKAEEAIELLNLALKETSTRMQELHLKSLLVEVLYRQCAIGYFTAYDAGDTETLAMLEEKYQLCVSYGNEYFGSSWLIGIYSNSRFTPQPTLEDEAWYHWNHERASLLPEGAITSAMPEKWADWYETSETETSA